MQFDETTGVANEYEALAGVVFFTYGTSVEGHRLARLILANVHLPKISVAHDAR